MFDVSEKPKMVERAMLAGVMIRGADEREAASLLEELEELVNTLGVPVIDRQLITIREPNPALYMGKGKAEELTALAKEQDCDVIIFDHELSPAQQRNWEKFTGITVIDRQEVIIDIFAQRAQTKEARLQVELARLEYSLPRLRRAWSHLGKQAGGIGGRGEGEQQLEIDKRLVRGHIETLKKELADVRRIRATQRKERKRTPVPNCAIVGYTNAGKSSLLRRLTGADVLVEDKLFATLDTTTRKISLPTNQELLLTDTVGFVRKLPHRLVEAFKATLEEAVLAEFLIHLLDASSPQVFAFHETTRKVLQELGADDKKTLTVFNKIDQVKDPADLAALRLHFPGAHYISVHTGQGLEGLYERMSEFLADQLVRIVVRIPHTEGDVLARLHREAQVLQADYDGDAARVSVMVAPRFREQLASYIVSEPPSPAASAKTTPSSAAA